MVKLKRSTKQWQAYGEKLRPYDDIPTTFANMTELPLVLYGPHPRRKRNRSARKFGPVTV